MPTFLDSIRTKIVFASTTVLSFGWLVFNKMSSASTTSEIASDAYQCSTQHLTYPTCEWIEQPSSLSTAIIPTMTFSASILLCIIASACHYPQKDLKKEDKKPKNSTSLPEEKINSITDKEEKKQENFTSLPKEKINAITNKAMRTFFAENREYGGESLIGGEFGFFSSHRHSTKEARTFEAELKKCSTHAETEQFIQTQIINNSLWFDAGHSHAFMNYFLNCLRYENIHAYRDIVGRTCGITFISGSITLYRYDQREENIIFNKGFTLKEYDYNYSKINYSTIRKSFYSRVTTKSYGISFAKKPPPNGSYGCNLYTIVLSNAQDFLLIDINESTKNKPQLTEFHLNLQEVNSLDNIPPTAVKTMERVKHAEQSFLFANKRFSPSATLRDNPIIFKGCCY